MRGISSVTIGALALVCVASLNAAKGPSHDAVDQTKARRGTISIPDDPKHINATARLLWVENVRLEAPVHAEAAPSTLLKFDVFNGASTPLTDLVLEISVRETSALTELSGRALVRPFTIRGNVVLQAGYTVNFELLLRNLSSDCRCIANVDIVSVHWLPEAGS
jgi:hypothetical protein